MILFESVTKKYAGDAEPAVDDVSLHIEPNEFVFLVGKSGAGKSTLTKMITKEEIPDSGKIIVGGIDLDYVKKRHIPGYRRRLGVVFQDFKLLPRRTVYENVAFALEIAGMSGKEIRRTVPKVLELVDLLDQAKKFPDQLSGGQQQRVSIARSVARQPKILIADEPTANLDKLTTQEIIDLLQRINDFGTTILVTTHNEQIVNNLSKRVVTMKGGKIVDDQKNNGVYKLDEVKLPEQPVRAVQEPGHALSPEMMRRVVRSEQLAKVAEEKRAEISNTRTVNQERVIRPVGSRLVNQVSTVTSGGAMDRAGSAAGTRANSLGQDLELERRKMAVREQVGKTVGVGVNGKTASVGVNSELVSRAGGSKEVNSVNGASGAARKVVRKVSAVKKKKVIKPVTAMPEIKKKKRVVKPERSVI